MISIRPVEDIIAIWNKTADDTTITGKIRSVVLVALEKLIMQCDQEKQLKLYPATRCIEAILDTYSVCSL